MIQQNIIAAIAAFAIVAVLAPVAIPLLRRMKAGQSIREEGPKAHQKKAGTPTMGGLIMIPAVVAVTLWFGGMAKESLLALFLFLGYALVGLADDALKVVFKRNLGLTARQKLVGQFFIAAVYFSFSDAKLHQLWLPWSGQSIEIGAIAGAIFSFLVMVGTTNAVNLTDGLDGLAAGVTVITASVYAYVAASASHPELALFATAVAGACAGFLLFNAHPAKVFMGDTGSLALGGALAALALETRTELLLVVIGGVYVAEALSVILQVISFQSTGKRIFLMSPIHHHFELKGWREWKVVLVFWGVSAVLGFLALLIWHISKMGVNG